MGKQPVPVRRRPARERPAEEPQRRAPSEQQKEGGGGPLAGVDPAPLAVVVLFCAAFASWHLLSVGMPLEAAALALLVVCAAWSEFGRFVVHVDLQGSSEEEWLSKPISAMRREQQAEKDGLASVLVEPFCVSLSPALLSWPLLAAAELARAADAGADRSPALLQLTVCCTAVHVAKLCWWRHPLWPGTGMAQSAPVAALVAFSGWRYWALMSAAGPAGKAGALLAAAACSINVVAGGVLEGSRLHHADPRVVATTAAVVVHEAFSLQKHASVPAAMSLILFAPVLCGVAHFTIVRLVARMEAVMPKDKRSVFPPGLHEPPPNYADELEDEKKETRGPLPPTRAAEKEPGILLLSAIAACICAAMGYRMIRRSSMLPELAGVLTARPEANVLWAVAVAVPFFSSALMWYRDPVVHALTQVTSQLVICFAVTSAPPGHSAAAAACCVFGAGGCMLSRWAGVWFGARMPEPAMEVPPPPEEEEEEGEGMPGGAQDAGPLPGVPRLGSRGAAAAVATVAAAGVPMWRAALRSNLPVAAGSCSTAPHVLAAAAGCAGALCGPVSVLIASALGGADLRLRGVLEKLCKMGFPFTGVHFLIDDSAGLLSTGLGAWVSMIATGYVAGFGKGGDCGAEVAAAVTAAAAAIVPAAAMVAALDAGRQIGGAMAGSLLIAGAAAWL